MKNLNLLLTGIILLSFGCNPQPEQEEVHTTTVGIGTPYYRAPEVLNGKVKEVKETVYLAVEEDGKYVKGERMSEAARDTLGWTASFIAQFDRGGNLVRSAEVDPSDIELNVNTQDIVDGKPVAGNYFFKDTLRVASYATYNDAEGYVNYERRKMPEDTLINNVKVYYDSIGAYKAWEFFNPSDEMTYRYEFTSSDEGIITGYDVFNRDGEKVFVTTSTLNDHGFSTRKVMTNIRTGEEVAVDMEYTYDDTGNWISRVVTAPDVVVIEERSITYYDDESGESDE